MHKRTKLGSLPKSQKRILKELGSSGGHKAAEGMSKADLKARAQKAAKKSAEIRKKK